MATEHDEQHSGRFSIIPATALDDVRLTPALLRLLCLLGTYGDKYGYCHPKLSTLAHRVGNVSKQAVSKNLQQLKTLGWIEIIPQFGKDGGRAVNHYRILFDQRPEIAPQVDTRQLPEVEGGQLPEVEGGQLPEVDTLNVPYERPILTLSSAATLSSLVDSVDGSVDAAAATWDDNILRQTAEGVRTRLGMPLRNTPGIEDILRQYPPAPAYFYAQAAACQEKLRVRPLKLAHFATFLRNEEIARRQREQENVSHDAITHETSNAIQRDTAHDAQEASRRRELGAALLAKYDKLLSGSDG